VDASRVYRSDCARLIDYLTPLPVAVISIYSVVSAFNGAWIVALFCVGADAWVIRDTGWRVAYELRVDDNDLIWRAPFSSRRLARSAVMQSRTSRLRPDISLLVRSDGAELRVRKGSGLTKFLSAALIV